MITDPCLHKILEQSSKEESQQRPSEVQPFVTIVITIVELTTAQVSEQQSVHHVT